MIFWGGSSQEKPPYRELWIQLGTDQKVSVPELFWGFPYSHGGTPNSWMVYVRENPTKIWMMTGGTPMT